ncbi:MAG: hypothetical protein R2941_10005 [Desulfobacterales bacterium]
MIHVSDKEIQKSYRKHKSIWISAEKDQTAPNYSHKMVLFYAVECGLKSLYMKEFRLRMTNQENTEGRNITEFGHNLNEILNVLKMFNVKKKEYQLPQVEAEDKNQISPEDMHQAWRYGKKLNDEKELQFVNSLKKILTELEGRV